MVAQVGRRHLVGVEADVGVEGTEDAAVDPPIPQIVERPLVQLVVPVTRGADRVGDAAEQTAALLTRRALSRSRRHHLVAAGAGYVLRRAGDGRDRRRERRSRVRLLVGNRVEH